LGMLELEGPEQHTQGGSAIYQFSLAYTRRVLYTLMFFWFVESRAVS